MLLRSTAMRPFGADETGPAFVADGLAGIAAGMDHHAVGVAIVDAPRSPARLPRSPVRSGFTVHWMMS